MVVDMESSDDTIKIAKKYATVIYTIPATDGKGKAIGIVEQVRNQFLAKVKTEWTLIVDSDEEIPATLASKIQELILTQSVNGYRIPRKNVIFGKWIEHTGFWPDYIVRLFRTGKGKHPETIHDQLEVNGAVEDLPIDSDLAILHHHYTSVEQFLMRMNVYTTFEAQRYFAQVPAADRQRPDFFKSFFDQFFSRFFASEGYMDGSHGLVLSLLLAVSSLATQMKIWETMKLEEPVDIEDVEVSINDACRASLYWEANEKLKGERNLLKKIGYLIQRKFNS